MVGMSLPVDRGCDHELKVKGVPDIKIGDWTQDSEASPIQTRGGNSPANAASATSSQGPSPSLWGNGDPGGSLPLLQNEEDCEALESTLRGED